MKELHLSEYNKEISEKKLNSFYILFLVLNALKITLFNFSIMNYHSLETFIFKFMLSLLIAGLLYPIIFKIPRKIGFIIFYIIEGVYVFSNISYFMYFRNYLHLFQSAALFTEGVGQVKHFTIPVNYRHVVMLIDLPMFIWLLKNYSFKDNMALIYGRYRRYAKYIITCLAILILGNEAWNYTKNNSILDFVKDYSIGEPRIVERYGTVANNICDIIFNSGGKNLMSHIKYGEEQTNTNNKNKSNFIVIQVESMDSNIINKKYDNQFIMPYLKELSEKNIYYPYVLSYHKAGGTSDSEFSAINSVEPLGNFPSIKLPKYEYPNSVVKKLTAASYSTLAFHGNIGNYYNRDVAFSKMGFKNFFDIKQMGFNDVGWGAPDADLFNYTLKSLEQVNGPFFSYIITLTSHTPFNSVKNYYSNNLFDSIKDEKIKNYFTSFSYVDKAIEDFIKEVKSKYSDTYILIFGDHTPDINTVEYKQAAFQNGDSYMEFVPFIILTPDNKSFIEDKSVASFLDIAPTILEASGIQYSYNTDGKNLMDSSITGKEIPFEGRLYDRNELLNKLLEELN